MGTTFDILVVGDDPDAARASMDAALDEVARVEELLSEWKDTSEISAVNRSAGDAPVPVGRELYEVVDRSIEISRETRGAFDVTFAACGSLWSFAEPRIPSDAELSECLGRVGFERIELDASGMTIRLPEPGWKIGIAGIGKGYGVDRAASVLEQRGVTRYIVDGGGDIRVRGTNVGRPWRLGIAHPRRPGELYATFELDGGSVVTSGDYQQFFERGGVRYHHVLDPSTGRPAREAIAVTVVAPTATEADALATGLIVLGPEAGLEIVEALPGVEALFFGPEMKVLRSAGFPAIQE